MLTDGHRAADVIVDTSGVELVPAGRGSWDGPEWAQLAFDFRRLDWRAEVSSGSREEPGRPADDQLRVGANSLHFHHALWLGLSQALPKPPHSFSTFVGPTSALNPPQRTRLLPLLSHRFLLAPRTRPSPHPRSQQLPRPTATPPPARNPPNTINRDGVWSGVRGRRKRLRGAAWLRTARSQPWPQPPGRAGEAREAGGSGSVWELSARPSAPGTAAPRGLRRGSG